MRNYEEKQRKIHWKKIGVSFLIAVCYALFLEICTEVYAFYTGSPYIGGVVSSSGNVFRLLHSLFVLVFAIWAVIRKTSKYENGIPAWAVLLLGGLGVLGMWVVFYRFLLIHNEIHETQKKNKKKLSEAAAALVFVLKVNDWVLKNDAAIKSSIQEILGNKCPSSNFKKYYDELNYATLAFLMPEIRNLFDEPQAQRLENKVYEAVSIVGDVSLLQIYLNTEKEYFDPLSIPCKLLRRWMGEDIELDAVENRLACLQIRCCLLPIRGLWKDIQNTYRIVKSDEKVEQFVKSVGEINIDDIIGS